MIDGVVFQKLEKYCDDRGTFMEIVREDQHLLRQFGQMSVPMSYPGVIKEFHYHREQDDLWHFVSGNAPLPIHAYNRERPDEERLPWNDPDIGFDWTTRFR